MNKKMMTSLINKVWENLLFIVLVLTIVILIVVFILLLIGGTVSGWILFKLAFAIVAIGAVTLVLF